MKTNLAIIFVSLGMLAFLERTGAQSNERYTPAWESLKKHHSVPEWLRDAKFGIYTHWGVYAVPAYNNEHYYRTMHHDSEYSKH